MPGSADAGDGTGGTADTTKALTSAGIGCGVILNANINACAAIAVSKLEAICSGQIIVGNACAVGALVAVSGDITITNAGVTAIGALKVTSGMLAGSIALSKLTDAPEANATADQSNAEIKTAYEANACTNAVTDAEKTVLGNTSGTNTGDGNIGSITNGSVLFSASCAVAQDNANLFYCNTCNNFGVGTSTPTATLHISGTNQLCHTATESDDHGFELDINAAGFGDVKAFDANFTTGAIAVGEEEEVFLSNIDESLSCGGEINAFEVLSTSVGCATVYGMTTGINVAPIEHNSGTFGDMDSILVCACSQLTALQCGGAGNITFFPCDNNTVTIGDAATFQEVEFLVCTGASGPGVAPTFEFSTAACSWTAFSPTDSTNGFRNTGELLWLAEDTPSWATHGGEYKIRITRTRNSITTDPIIDLVQISSTNVYHWSKDGDVHVSTLALEERACAIADVAGRGQFWVKTATPNTPKFTDDAGTDFDLAAKTGTQAAIETIAIALGDESTVLAAASTCTPVVTMHMPYAFTLTDIKVGLTVAGTGAALVTVDVHEAGTTVMACTKVTVDASEKTSGTAATPAVISAPDLAEDSLIEIFVDLVDTNNLAAGMKVYLIGYKT
jgi:hypothetical protein